MSGTKTKWVLGVAMTLALLLAPGVGVSTVFAGAPTRVSGGGEATAGSVTYTVIAPGPCGDAGVVHSGTGPGSGASLSSTGHRITFGFNATKSGSVVRGQMQLVDHDEGLVIHSDVASVTVPHLSCAAPILAPVLSTGGVAAKISGSVGGAVVTFNGVPLTPTSPLGWTLANSPAYDGGEGGGSTDTVCFELFDGAPGPTTKFRQWSAVLSAGNVQVVQ